MGGGNAQKSAMARSRKMAENNKQAVSLLAVNCIIVENAFYWRIYSNMLDI